MNQNNILMLVSEAIVNSQNDPEDLVQLLEISVEDIIRKFPSKLVEHAEKFGVYENPMEEEE
jgi:chorismate mutase